MVVASVLGAGTAVATAQMNKPKRQPTPPRTTTEVSESSRASRERQRRIAASSSGANSTRRTGPLGLQGQSSGQASTLLGE